ncbi:MAG: hypothetical protein Q8Q33_04820, partial [Chlamydiota bacterium]|nr:hypothetical protein [Chlamydiota bacterium]
QGAVAGALAGAYYGYDAIPKSWRNTLMRNDYIADLAERLYNSENLVTKVLYIINNSGRKMPAHFTSNGDRTQSFCVDFDINEADEYAMASKAWQSSTDQSVTKTGEDIMLASYMVTKLEGDIHIPQLYESIVRASITEITNDHKRYFQHCMGFGKQLAKTAK